MSLFKTPLFSDPFDPLLPVMRSSFQYVHSWVPCLHLSESKSQIVCVVPTDQINSDLLYLFQFKGWITSWSQGDAGCMFTSSPLLYPGRGWSGSPGSSPHRLPHCQVGSGSKTSVCNAATSDDFFFFFDYSFSEKVGRWYWQKVYCGTMDILLKVRVQPKPLFSMYKYEWKWTLPNR